MREKIVTRERAAELREEFRRAGKRVGFTSGVFDILHPGHVDYLENARAQADVLIVGLNSDASVRANKGEQRPVNGEEQRAEVLAGLQSVDLVFVFGERNNNQNVELLKPDLYLKAGDYDESQLSSKPLVESHGGEVRLVPFRTGLSTSAIIDRIVAAVLTADGPAIAYGQRPAVFVDRDGTINEHVEYLSDPKLFKEIPGSFAALKTLRDAGYRIVVVTNQPGIGLGYFSREDFFAVNREMMRQATKQGLSIDKIYFCPHSKSDSCECRKPLPHFLRRAERELNVDLTQSFMIGDMSSDVQTGKNGGCRTILVKTGRGGDDGICEARADVEVASLAQAAAWIAQQGPVKIGPAPGPAVPQRGAVEEAVTKLSGTLGHDFNTILGSILGCAALIGQRTAGRDGKSSVGDILSMLRKAANRGLALSRRLMTVAGRDEDEKTRKSLRSCVDAVAELLASSHGQECHFEVLCPEDVEVELADSTVAQMLLELGENALDAMQGLPERFILFHVDRVEVQQDAALLEVAPGTYGRVSIVDHGDGAEPFDDDGVVQTNVSSKSAHLGRGLGLSMLMAKSVMKKHGGTVTLASRRKAGTNISLYFPVA